jgi:hypothetical protein
MEQVSFPVSTATEKTVDAFVTVLAILLTLSLACLVDSIVIAFYICQTGTMADPACVAKFPKDTK